MAETRPHTTSNAQDAIRENADRRLAEGKQQRDEVLAEHKRREAWKPTPTQEENDRAALGQNVLEKEPDGSPEMDTYLEPGAGGSHQTRHMGAGGRGQPYSTRQSTPQHHAPTPPRHEPPKAS